MTAPFYLHWGSVKIDITINGVDPSSGNITPGVDSGVNTPSSGRGSSKMVGGRGSSKKMKGSGGSG